MPWSDWQDPVTISGTYSWATVTRTTDTAGTDPTTNKVSVYRSSLVGSVVGLRADKQLYNGSTSASQSGWQWYTRADWATVRTAIPGSLQSLIRGVQYSIRPDQTDPAAPDAYVEYEAGGNTLTWPSLTFNLNNNSGDPAGDYRIKILPTDALNLSDGTYPLSTWGASIDAATVVYSGSGTDVVPKSGIAEVTPEANQPAFFIFVESDGVPDSVSNVSLTVSFTESSPIITTPRWRYWIPDRPTFPPVPAEGHVRAMMVDCTGDAPVVTSDVLWRSDLHLAYTPVVLFIPSLSRIVVCTTGEITTWDAVSGALLSTITIFNTYMIGVYGNPADPTECVVVTGAPLVLFVVKGLDTSTPYVDRAIWGYPSGNPWLVAVGDPYRAGSGALDANQISSDYGQPVVADSLQTPGLIRTLVTVDGVYVDDTAGTAPYGDAGVVFQYIAENDNDFVQGVILMDNRDPVNPKALNFNWDVFASVVPNFVSGGFSGNWLSAGSFTTSADGKSGVILSGYTVLSDDPPDTTTIPGTTIYLNEARYGVVVTKIVGPPFAPQTNDIIPLLSTPPIKRTIAVEVVAPTFRLGATNAIVPPDAQHVVVGSAPLDATDNSSYLEVSATGTYLSGSADRIGGILDVPALAAGEILSGGVTIDIGFYSTDWATNAPWYGMVGDLVPVLSDGSLDSSNSKSFSGDNKPFGVWNRSVMTTYHDLEPAQIQAILTGSAFLGVYANPSLLGAAPVFRVSYLRLLIDVESFS